METPDAEPSVAPLSPPRQAVARKPPCVDPSAEIAELQAEMSEERDIYIAQHCTETTHRIRRVMEDGKQYQTKPVKAWICDGMPRDELPGSEVLPSYAKAIELSVAYERCKNR